MDLGSSFLPSEIIAAFLYAQLKNLDVVQQRRKEIWTAYLRVLTTGTASAGQGYLNKILTALSGLRAKLPYVPAYSSNNAHLFYLVFGTGEERAEFIKRLQQAGIMAIPHYQPLHLSPFYKDKHDGRALPQAVKYAECLVRLPLYFELGVGEDIN